MNNSSFLQRRTRAEFALRALTAIFALASLWSFDGANGLECECNSQRLSKRIKGGEVAPEGRFPYMCSLRYRGTRNHACGAVLIDKKWAITAAHCVYPKKRDSAHLNPILYCGANDLDTTNATHTFQAKMTYIHPEYTGEVKDGYDIALIKLDKKAYFPTPSFDEQNGRANEGQLVTVIGWGTDDDGGTSSKLKMLRFMTYIPRETCEKDVGPLTDHMFCASFAKGDAAEGDSGGPIFVADEPGRNITLGEPKLDYVIGLVSYGPEEPDGTTPGVYTAVGSFWKWIRTIINPEGDTCRFDCSMCENSGKEREEVETPSPLSGNGKKPKEPSQEVKNITKTLQGLSEQELLRTAIDAIAEDDYVTLEACLYLGVDVESSYILSQGLTIGTTEATMLMLAATWNATNSTKVLLDYGADLETSNLLDLRAIHHAAFYGNLYLLEMLLKRKAEVDPKDNRDLTPLWFATSQGYELAVEVLMENGADPDHAESSHGWRPVHKAAYHNYALLLEVLISAEADINARITLRGRFDLNFYPTGECNAYTEEATALHIAANYGNIQAAVVLVKGGASKTIKAGGRTPYDVVCSYSSIACSGSTERSLDALLKP